MPTTKKTKRWCVATACTLLALITATGCHSTAKSSTSTPAPSSQATFSAQTWDDITANTTWEQLIEEERTNTREYYLSQGMVKADQNLDIPFVRTVEFDEVAHVYADCFKEQGVGATAYTDTSMSFDPIPDSQTDDFNYADYVCLMKYPVNPVARKQLPKQAAEQLYDHFVNTGKPCVEKHGIIVPDPPSKEAWLDEYARTQTYLWSPFDEVQKAIPDQAERNPIYLDCQEEPDDFYPKPPQPS